MVTCNASANTTNVHWHNVLGIASIYLAENKRTIKITHATYRSYCLGLSAFGDNVN